MHSVRINNKDIPLEKSIVMLELVLLAVFFGLYGYGIVTSVVNVVLREELEVRVQQTESEVAELESKYLARVSGLTRETATELGLVELARVSYVDVNEVGTALTRRDE
jgi:hypothetical protein